MRTQAFKEWFGDWEKVATFNAGIEKLEKMKPVASITGNEFAQTGKNDLVQRVVDYWAQHGNVAHNPMLGDVKLDTRAAKDSMAHGIRRLESAAFAAVRDVIERGGVLSMRRIGRTEVRIVMCLLRLKLSAMQNIFVKSSS